MDPLSEALALVDLQSAATARFEAGGAWAVQFPAKPHLKFNAVLRGECWISLPGAEPYRLETGDTFLLADAPPFNLASDPYVKAVDFSDLPPTDRPGVIHAGGDDTVLLGGGFVFRSDDERLLLDSLPPFIHIASREPSASVQRVTLEVLDRELRTGGMGTALVTRRLADIFLVQALRTYVDIHGTGGAGWIGALNDRQIGAALCLMHGDVGRRWTVDELASAVGMSRSGFALRFRTLVGIPPLDYLTRWRMNLARDALRRGEGSVARLATRFGYASESAFGNAFKRVMGRSPKRYWSSPAG